MDFKFSQTTLGKINVGKKDEQTRRESDMLNATFRLALDNLYKKAQAGVLDTSPKTLFLLYQLREQMVIDEVADSASYFENCDACQFFRACSLFKEGGECGYKISKSLESSKDIVDMLVQLMRIESDRIQRSLLVEKLDAGSINRNVSAEIMQFFEMARTFKEIIQEEESVTLKVKGKGKGVISQLFGDLVPSRHVDEDDASDDVVDAEVVVPEQIEMQEVEVPTIKRKKEKVLRRDGKQDKDM